MVATAEAAAATTFHRTIRRQQGRVEELVGGQVRASARCQVILHAQLPRQVGVNELDAGGEHGEHVGDVGLLPCLQLQFRADARRVAPVARPLEEAQRQEAEALGHAQRAAVPQVVKLAEGDVEKQPLPAIFVAEAGVEDWGNQHLAQLTAGVDPVLERGLNSEMFVESAVALLHLPLRARLAKELEARHVRSPGAGQVVLQPLWQRSPAAISPH